MTYEEYKNKKNSSTKERKSNSFLKKLFSKFFTIVIFVMLVVIVSNYSESFRNFIINDVLNSTMDFSKVNNLVDNMTSMFKTEDKDSLPVASINESKPEKYMDGVKYIIGENENVLVKDSGIVTFIGNKDGYNNTVIIQQSNGYYAWYGNVKESIKLYDYVESGSILGSASNEYYYVLLKDDKPVDILNEN